MAVEKGAMAVEKGAIAVVKVPWRLSAYQILPMDLVSRKRVLEMPSACDEIGICQTYLAAVLVMRLVFARLTSIAAVHASLYAM